MPGGKKTKKSRQPGLSAEILIAVLFGLVLLSQNSWHRASRRAPFLSQFIPVNSVNVASVTIAGSDGNMSSREIAGWQAFTTTAPPMRGVRKKDPKGVADQVKARSVELSGVMLIIRCRHHILASASSSCVDAEECAAWAMAWQSPRQDDPEAGRVPFAMSQARRAREELSNRSNPARGKFAGLRQNPRASLVWPGTGTTWLARAIAGERRPSHQSVSDFVESRLSRGRVLGSSPKPESARHLLHRRDRRVAVPWRSLVMAMTERDQRSTLLVEWTL